MFVYILTFVASSVGAFLYSFSKDKSARVIFLILTFLSLFLPAALRYGIGIDYYSYLKIYSNIYHGYKINQEIGIIFISRILQFFRLSGHALIVTYSFLTILFIFLAIPKKYFFLAIPVYVLYFYLDSYCLLRQALACAIMVYAIRLFFEGKKIRFCFWCFIAILNHKVAIIPSLLVILFQILPKGKGQRYTILFAVCFVALYFIRSSIVDFLMLEVVPLTPFARYAQNSYSTLQAELNTGLGFSLRYFCLGILLYLICIGETQNSKRKFAIGSAFYLLFAGNLATVLYIFVRLVNSYSFVYVYLISSAWKAKSKIRKLILLFFFFSSFLLYVKGIVGTPITGKAGDGKQIYPYVSVFNKYEHPIVRNLSLRVPTIQY